MANLETYNRVVAVGVDIQNDFCPGGSLAVNEGDQVIAPFNNVAEWVRSLQTGLVVLTRDWHPPQTSHFGNPPDFVRTWPVHCVRETPGAQFHPDLQVNSEDHLIEMGKEDIILSKGTGVNEDGYSGFDGFTHDGLTLEAVLQPVNHERVAVVIGGLATDYCVKHTVLDALKFADRFKDNPARHIGVFVLADAIKPVSLVSGAAAKREMWDKGARFVNSNDLIHGRVMKVEELVQC